MRGFKDSYKGQAKVKERKNRRAELDNLMYTFFVHYRRDPEFLKEDFGFNIDAELEYDFAIKGQKLA